MVFNSVTFLIFFLVFFNLYWLINHKLPVVYRNAFTLLSSYVFYGWWDWRFLSLILISSGADFAIGWWLGKSTGKNTRKLLLVLSIAVNLGILGYFKYFNFFIESLNHLLSVLSISVNVKSLSIILPVGISFYTFQTLSYTIDIYKSKIQPSHNIFSFFAFVAFFPQLVAGPIERAANLLGQFSERKIFQYHHCVIGLRLILWGLFKKIVIADNFGVLVDHLYSAEFPVSGLSTLLGAFFFSLQIYADFSGYSDIAIGVAKMLGMDLMRNFAAPYFSASFTEFWHRWHISLSTWFRDYVYIPLGGSRAKKFRVNLNILITFFLSGLWHGAKSTFVIWGALHGIVLLIEKWIKLRISRIVAAPVVYIIVIILWIPFRAENFQHLKILMKSIFQFSSYTIENIYPVIKDFSALRFLVLMMVVAVFSLVERNLNSVDFSGWIAQKSRLSRLSFYYVLVILIILLGNFDVKPYFIYFQF